MSWPHIDSWKEAAASLGVTVSGPAVVMLDSGETVSCDLLFEHFGAPRGTLVFDKRPNVDDRRFIESGYTYSVFDRPSEGVTYSRSDLQELLIDWGWCGPDAETPAWIKSTRTTNP